MNYTKAECLLFMYDLLFRDKILKRDIVINQLGIRSLTFYRYIKELISLLSLLDVKHQVTYNKTKKEYILFEKNTLQ